MCEEYFYGITLSSSHKTETWDPDKTDHPRNKKLIIRQALLGPDAKPDENNVVEVETMTVDKSIKIPMAVLRVGDMRHARLDIEFQDAPVTFTLKEGSGPVHLIGLHVLEISDDNEDMDEIEEGMMEEEEEDGEDSQHQEEDDEEDEPKGKKGKMTNNAKGKSPAPKKKANKK